MAVCDERVWLEETRNRQVVWVPVNVIKETWAPKFRPGDDVQTVNGIVGVVTSVYCMMDDRAYNVAFGNTIIRCLETDLVAVEEEIDE